MNLHFSVALDMNRQDQILLSKLKAGDPRAVERWFKQYKTRLFRYVVSRVSSAADAEEIVQETFVNCLKHLPLFRGQSSLWTWMCSIAKHEVADYFRKRYAKKALQTLPLSELLASKDTKDAHELATAVRTVLTQMKPGYKELLLKKYVDKAKVKELANDMGRSVKAVESDLFRAREEFRVLWAQTSYE